MTIRYLPLYDKPSEADLEKLRAELGLSANDFQRVKYNLGGTGQLPEADFQKVKAHLERGMEMVRKFPDEFQNLRDVTVLVLGGRCNPDSKTAGYRLTNHVISITADPEQPCYNDPEDKTLERVLAHELDHLVRFRRKDNGRSLGENLVVEGLAQAFERQATDTIGKTSVAVATRNHRRSGPISSRDFGPHSVRL